MTSSSEKEYVGYAKHGTLKTHHGLESVKWKFTSKQSLEDLFKENLTLAKKERPPPLKVNSTPPTSCVLEDFECIDIIKEWADEILGERGINPSDVKGPVNNCVTYHMHEDMCIYERPESTESVAVTFYCPVTEISITTMDSQRGAKIQIYNANGSLDQGFFVSKSELEKHVDTFISRVVKTPVRVNHMELWARAQELTSEEEPPSESLPVQEDI